VEDHLNPAAAGSTPAGHPAPPFDGQTAFQRDVEARSSVW
jgi:hypothetical protein